MMFKTIHYIRFDSIDSTHSWGKNHIQTLEQGVLTCITAHAQTAGYGRKHKHWIAPPGTNITATLCFFLPLGSTILGNLGQLLSLCVVSILQKKGFQPALKWPNDILLIERKVAGVLCETSALQGQIGVTLSLGLNVNMSEEELSQIDQPAASLFVLSGKKWNVEELLKAIVEEFCVELPSLLAQGFSPFQHRYEKLLAFKDKTIRTSDGREGKFEAVLPDGRLQLRLPDGSTTILN